MDALDASDLALPGVHVRVVERCGSTNSELMREDGLRTPALLAEIRERLRLAMLFITHDLRVAAQVCDTVAVMSQGRVVEYGAAREVFGNPQHAYTRSLFAAAPGRNWAFGAAAPA